MQFAQSTRKQAQSTGKLDSCMRGPYRVMKLLPHGRYELQLLAGSCGKSTQAAAEFMIPWRGEWTPEVCAAYFDDADNEDEESTLATTGQPADDGEQPSTSVAQMPEHPRDVAAELQDCASTEDRPEIGLSLPVLD
ncbi:hypothetical protein evm_014962 [Chilo suppressalis]|nr:hypothetical protein evm_014962 [Chilo suppressalis]